MNIDKDEILNKNANYHSVFLLFFFKSQFYYHTEHFSQLDQTLSQS